MAQMKRAMPQMRTERLLVLVCLCAFAWGCSRKDSGGTAESAAAALQPTTPPIDPTLWLTAGPGHAADFDSAISRARLVERFGAANVVEDSVQSADMPSVPGTVLFPNDSTRRLEIIWADPTTQTRPERVDLRGESGRWAADPGIRLGMRLTDLERINGVPFTVMGFDWDYGGTVTNWRGGRLARKPSELPRIFIQLSPAETDTGAIRNSVAGDREFSSKSAAMQQLNPHVVSISVAYVLPRQ